MEANDYNLLEHPYELFFKFMNYLSEVEFVEELRDYVFLLKFHTIHSCPNSIT